MGRTRKEQSQSFNDKIILISDFFIDDFVGGAALNDEEIFTLLSEKFDVYKIKSRYLYPGFIQENLNSFFIISNFFGVSPPLLQLIQQKCKYILYCHDYKFVQHTNPALYPDFRVPPNELVNVTLHQDAHRIVCQTQFQKDIYDLNLNLSEKTINFSGNLWSPQSLDLLETYSSKEKNNKCAVIDSPYPQKGTQASVDFCNQKKWDFDLIKDPDYGSFLEKLAGYSKLVFHPFTPETCCRVVLEAKMMNLEIETNHLVGASYEEWYLKKGVELINLMREKRDNFTDFLRPLIHG